MTKIKQVFNEEDVTLLNAGDKVFIAGRIATRRNRVGDGIEYVINNGERTLTKINLRTYQLDDGQIIPLSYSTEEVNLK